MVETGREGDHRVLRGFNTVAQALREEDFPMDIHDVDYAVGDIEVEDGKGGFVFVRDLTDRFKKKQFENAHEVLEEIQNFTAHGQGRVA